MILLGSIVNGAAIAVGGFAGLFVGIIGSWTSIRKFLDV